MGKFAKNYLPIMFNIYTTEIAIENESIRQTFLDTIKCYLEIADPELVNLYISQAINNLENYSKLTEKHQKEIEIKKSKDASVVFDFNTTKKETLPIQLSNLYVFAKHGFMDLLAILVKFSNDSNIPIIFELAVERINDSTGDKTDQKKCYKILNAILNSGKLSSKQTRNQSVFSFIENKFESIVKVFTSSLGKCNAAAKVPRLKCLINLMDYVVKPEQRTIVRFLLPEIILCVKELNHISRETAFQLLNSMLRLWQKLGINSTEPTTENDSLNEFFHLVMVGLAGSTNMISCTCIAMASLVHEFRDQISGSLIGELIETACLLSKSEIKEIIISSMNLLKTLCSVFPTTTLAQYLKKISDVIYSLHEKRGTNMAEENSFNNMAPVSKSQQIRSLVKLTLKKLIKKFTYQIIFENIFAFEKPSHDKTEDKRILTAIIKQGLENLLTNLRKSIEKDKKRKMEEKNTDKNSDKNIDLVSLYTSKTNKTTTNESKYNE
jgi:ribosomal RNA-processing protein 12